MAPTAAGSPCLIGGGTAAVVAPSLTGFQWKVTHFNAGCEPPHSLKGEGKRFFTWRLNLYIYTAAIYIWHICRRFMHYKRKT